MRGAKSAKSIGGVRKARPQDSMQASVAAIMSRKVQSVRPDTTLDSAMDVLMTKDLSHLPVVEDGVLVGVVSKTDLVRERFMNEPNVETGPMTVRSGRGASYALKEGYHEDPLGLRVVADIMSARVKTVKPSSTVAEAAIAMARLGVHGLPVVDEGGALVGFVSTLDVVRWVAQPVTRA